MLKLFELLENEFEFGADDAIEFLERAIALLNEFKRQDHAKRMAELKNKRVVGVDAP